MQDAGCLGGIAVGRQTSDLASMGSIGLDWVVFYVPANTV